MVPIKSSSLSLPFMPVADYHHPLSSVLRIRGGLGERIAATQAQNCTSPSCCLATGSSPPPPPLRRKVKSEKA